MATIKEDYVSFEVAKLLKEKGFDERCTHYYKNEKYLVDLAYANIHSYTNSDLVEEFAAPTLQMAMKWLREVHSLHIWIGHAAGKVLSWYYEIHGISDGKVKHIGGIQCGSYEVACESAIKYCLENLI